MATIATLTTTIVNSGRGGRKQKQTANIAPYLDNDKTESNILVKPPPHKKKKTKAKRIYFATGGE